LEREDDENDEREGAVADLSGGIAEDSANAGRVEAAVDVEPVAGGNPGEDAEAEQERFDGRQEEEFVRERQDAAEVVSKFERHSGEDDVR